MADSHCKLIAMFMLERLSKKKTGAKNAKAEKAEEDLEPIKVTLMSRVSLSSLFKLLLPLGGAAHLSAFRRLSLSLFACDNPRKLFQKSQFQARDKEEREKKNTQPSAMSDQLFLLNYWCVNVKHFFIIGS